MKGKPGIEGVGDSGEMSSRELHQEQNPAHETLRQGTNQVNQNEGEAWNVLTW